MKIKELLEGSTSHKWFRSTEDRRSDEKLRDKVKTDNSAALKKLQAELKKADEKGDIDGAEKIEKQIKMLKAQNAHADSSLSV